MLGANADVTVLARKLTVLILVAAFLLGVWFVNRTSPSVEMVDSFTIGTRIFNIELVTSELDKSQGLSGRESIAEDQVMVFGYSQVDTRCFWMKDMQFPIDIVWLDGYNKVTDIESGVDPSTYPQSFCHAAQNVVEFKAGMVGESGLKLGDSIWL